MPRYTVFHCHLDDELDADEPVEKLGSFETLEEVSDLLEASLACDPPEFQLYELDIVEHREDGNWIIPVTLKPVFGEPFQEQDWDYDPDAF